MVDSLNLELAFTCWKYKCCTCCTSISWL